MAIIFKKTVAVLDDICAIEEAETLLEWLLDNPKGKVNFKQCKHIHTAILQVLMVAKPTISAYPDSANVQQALNAIEMSGEQ